jgi:general secretion pathway protein K
MMNAPQIRRSKKRESGQALLIALGVTLILVSVLTVTASNQRTAMRAEANRMSQRRTYLVAQSAAQMAIQYLMEGQSGISATNTASSSSSTTTTSVVTTSVTTSLDDWATLGNTGAMKFVLGDTSFRMQIIDTCSLLDINQMTATQFVNIGLTQQEADCINDFKTAGETPAPDGAKDSYYNGLANPYNAKLARFDTFDELLQVEDVTPDVLYDPQNVSGTVTLQALTNGQMPALSDLCTAYAYASNTTASGGTRLNINTTPIPQLTQAIGPLATTLTTLPGGGGPVRRRTYANLGAIFTAFPNLTAAQETTILNNLTTTNGTQVEGLVNINTASQNVLMLLPNVTSDVAAAIVAQQQAGFSTLGAITGVSAVSSRLLASIADHICIASTTFEARIVATAGSAQTAYTAIVQVTAGVPKIVSITPTPFAASQMIIRWGWQTDTTDETDLVQSS